MEALIRGIKRDMNRYVGRQGVLKGTGLPAKFREPHGRLVYAKRVYPR